MKDTKKGIPVSFSKSFLLYGYAKKRKFPNYSPALGTKRVVQTNLSSIGKTHIFRTGMKSTFTWTMPYKSISVLVIT